MQWMDLTGVQAFDLLIRVSQDSNAKLVDVARSLVNQHESNLKSVDS
jgi:hypothetical protein